MLSSSTFILLEYYRDYAAMHYNNKNYRYI